MRNAERTFARQRSPLALPDDMFQDVLHILIALTLVVMTIACSIISMPFGVAVTLATTAVFAVVHPTSLPTIIAFSFLYQNTVIAMFGELIESDGAFDMLRGTNFVVLVASTGICVLGAIVQPGRLNPFTRRWLLASMAVVGVILVYLALGAARGAPRDAIVYFRNIVTPIACFVIGLVISSFYKAEMRRPIIVLGVGAIVYGYCELVFGFDFLALFNGDGYVERRIVRQIETGYWERILDTSGFVLRGLEDVMMTPMFNIPGMEGVFPNVLRLSGPNFHPISFAYGLAIISVWLLIRNRLFFALAALPILVIIGSKGALITLMAAMAIKLSLLVLPVRGTILAFFGAAILYLAAAIIYGKSVGDYHVLGLFAGLRDFFRNPIGQGLGFGGNLSSTIENNVDWSRAQLQGVADIPMESAFGVMIYQMGAAAMAYYGFLIALGRKCLATYLSFREPDALFGLVVIVMISLNSVLQEEAFFSPLSLGFALLLVGLSFGRTMAGSARTKVAP